MLFGVTHHAPDQPELQLLVAADSLLSRAGLTALLEEAGFTVLASVAGADLQRDIDDCAPDALVLDMGWSGQAMLSRLLAVESDLPIVALAADEDDALLSPLVDWLRGFPQFALLLREGDADLAAALSALDAGLTVIDPRLSRLLNVAALDETAPVASPLTAREDEALQCLARGLTNRAIAQELGISLHTVKFHVNAIMGKLGAQSRTEAVVRATRLGLITL